MNDDVDVDSGGNGGDGVAFAVAADAEVVVDTCSMYEGGTKDVAPFGGAVANTNAGIKLVTGGGGGGGIGDGDEGTAGF